jgi:hypothetical protein
MGKYEQKLRNLDVLRVRRAALGAMIAKGGVPRPGQFARAGLPPLFLASDLMAVAEDEEERRATQDRAAPEGRRRRLAGPLF